VGLVGSAHAALASGGAQVNDKVALVIGKGVYRIAPLANPSNDATAMTELMTFYTHQLLIRTLDKGGFLAK
jgi:hypothetical protein